MNTKNDMTYYLRLFYFHIYNTYYKDGDYTSDIPHLTAYGWVGTSLGCTVLVIFSIVGDMINGARMPNAVVWFAFGVTLPVAYFYFVYKRKYERIYTEFKGSKMNRKQIKIVSWVFVLAQFIIMIIYLKMFNAG